MIYILKFSVLNILWALARAKQNKNIICLFTEILYILRVVKHCFADVFRNVVVILGVKHVDYMGP